MFPMCILLSLFFLCAKKEGWLIFLIAAIIFF